MAFGHREVASRRVDSLSVASYTAVQNERAGRAHRVLSPFAIATDSGGVSLVEGEHATEPFASADAADGRGRIAGREGDDVAHALMVARGVVVLHELAHDGAQVTFAEGNDCLRHSCLIDRTNLSA